VPLSDGIKRIFDKRAGTIALVTLFSLLLLLKPSHAQSAKKVAVVAAPISQPASKKVAAKKVAPKKFADKKIAAEKEPPAVKDLVKPETGDIPLTAEQIAIAKIKSQVSEVANQYGEALFGSVQTNFKRGRLIVALNDGWYKLEPSKQTQLVKDLQNRAQTLSFKKLFVADAKNNLIARTPVTGEEVIILRQ
jgi:hypothetical protein